MFNTSIYDEYIKAAGAYELSKYNGTSKDIQEYLRGYMDAMEKAKEMFDEKLDPPMSDEDFLSSQARGLVNIAGEKA